MKPRTWAAIGLLLLVAAFGSWGQHAEATLDNPGAALTSFSLLVDLADMPTEWWSAVDTSDGTKGRVYKEDGTTRLAVDWIDFDDIAETGWIRTLYSGSLATSGTQGLQIQPPEAVNASVADNDTYGADNAYASHWVAYWPLDGGSAADRTVNAHDLTNNGATTGGTGKVGEAYDFEETESDYLSIADGLGLIATVTVIAWGNPETNTGNDKYAIVIDEAGTANHWLIGGGIETSDQTPFAVTKSTTAQSVAGTTTLWGTGAFQHLHMRLTSSLIEVILDRDTANKGTSSHSINPDDPLQTQVGRNVGGGGRYWDGLLDDIQVHDTNLTDAWVDHDHKQADDQLDFWNHAGTWTWDSGAAGAAVGVNLIEGEKFTGKLGGLVQ